MENEFKKSLDLECARTLEAVADAKTGSEEAKWNLTKLTELQKMRMNEIKLDTEAAEAKESKKDKIIRYILDGAAIVVPLIVSSYWMAKGLRFEQTGTFTSRTGQWLGNHLKLFRK